MISCQTFRANLTPGSADAEQLEHLRSCDACLDHAATVDPDLLFRALGGQELVPPGGIDAFAGEVMHEIQLRATEQRLAPRSFGWVRRLSIAATIAAGVTGATLVWQHEHANVPHGPAIVAQQRPAAIAMVTPSATKPVVETYDSKNATIVEVPAEDANNVKVVMIFDEKLPADL